MTTIAGWFFAMTFLVGHNFIHQRNNIRMYAVNLLLPMGFRDIRLAHAIVSSPSSEVNVHYFCSDCSHITCIPTLMLI